METTPNITIESLLKSTILESTVRAPSAHNTKPWLFDTAGNSVAFYVDLTKRLPIANPDDRELYISVGCALTNFIVAAQHAGFAAHITYAPIAPTSQPPKKLVATVTLEKQAQNAETQAATTQDSQLYPAINARFTDRTIYTNKPIPPAITALLHDCCTDDIQLFLLADRQKDTIAQLVYTGDKAQFNEPGYRQELARWINKGLVYHGFLRPIMSFAVRWFPVGSFVATHEKKLIESAPLFGVLCAKNDPLSWVQLGQVYETIALTATLHNIHTHPMNQGLTELPAQQQVLKKLLNTQNEPLFSFRLGYPKN